MECDDYYDEVLLPHWALSINIDKELALHAQLCTKDGRRVGNAFISCILNVKNKNDEVYKLYEVITDKGSLIRMHENEIHELYYIGNYICWPDHNSVKEE